MTPEKLLSYQLPLFDGLQASDFESINIDATEQRLVASQILFHQNDLSHDLFFLLSGDLVSLVLTADGREIVFSEIAHRAYLGEMAALDGGPRSLSVMAKTDATVLMLQRASFVALFDTLPTVRCKVTRRLVDRIRILTERNIEISTLNVEQRVGAFILRLAAQQEATLGTLIDPAPTHADIAGAIGANREMVSRSISSLARKGIISSARRRIEIVDKSALIDLIA